MKQDRAAFQDPPAVAYDACDKRSSGVSSLVRYRGNDYSVPTAYGRCKVLVRGYVHEVVNPCSSEIISRHPRSWGRGDFNFDPLHYLALIEHKTNALDDPSGDCRSACRCSECVGSEGMR
jgi:hypothetical protein